MSETVTTYLGTGRRKESTARVRLLPGQGEIIVNERPLDKYFGRESLRVLIKRPLQMTDTLKKFNVKASVRGGGMSGQAGAVCHGIARALLTMDENLKPVLRRLGFLTRDSRMKERKKYGQKGARARYQYSKR